MKIFPKYFSWVLAYLLILIYTGKINRLWKLNLPHLKFKTHISADLVRACVKVCFDLLRSRIVEKSLRSKTSTFRGFPMKWRRRDWFKSLTQHFVYQWRFNSMEHPYRHDETVVFFLIFFMHFCPGTMTTHAKSINSDLLRGLDRCLRHAQHWTHNRTS